MPADITLERGRPLTDAELSRRADWIRLQTIDLIAQAGLGHYSSTFSSAELVATLYYRALRLRPGEPNWPDRDRFLLGKGHVATGLWPVLADLGYYPRDWLKQFGKVGSPLNDHPNMKLAPRHRLLLRLARAQPVGRRGHGARGQAHRPRLPDLRAHRRRRAAGGPGLGGRDGRLALQARQPGRDRGRERLLRRRARRRRR